MPFAEITNTDRGPRGVHTVDGLVMIDPGKTESLDIPEHELADLPAHFRRGAPSLADMCAAIVAGAGGDGLDDKTTKELAAIVAAEGVTLPETGTGANGRVVKADVLTAIRAKRATPPAAPQGDALDGMTDEELRATVQALTGTEPAADADRAALLALARAE